MESEEQNEKVIKLNRNKRKGVSRLKETEDKKNAFRYYVNLGDTRSYRKVALHLNINPLTVGSWARHFDWENRLFKILESAERKSFNKTSGSLAKIIDGSKGKTVKEIVIAVNQLFKDIKIHNRMAKRFNKMLPKVNTERRKAGEKEAEPMKERRLINNLDDVEKGYKVAFMLTGENTNKVELVNTTTDAVVKDMEELLKRDPEARELVTSLYRKQFQVVNGENN